MTFSTPDSADRPRPHPLHRARRGGLTLGVALITAVLALGGVDWWTRPPSSLITTAQLLARLPSRSTVHSVVQADLDDGPPLEAAAVVMIPPFPGGVASVYTEVVARYDRWRRRLEIVYRRPLSGAVPVSVDAGRILGRREGVLFQGVTDTGRWAFRVVGRGRGGIAVLAEGESSDRITLADPWVIDRGAGRVLEWDGAGFVSRVLPAAVPEAAGAVTWRYAWRNGTVRARTNQVVLRSRQVLRLQRSGGGTTPIIVPDARLDVVENGFRARQPGTYAIRLLIPFASDAEAYVLTVLVSDTTPQPATMGP